ncbi:MAG: MFS transporter [archaeon]|nr:MFS transporter [archaeon]
MKTSTQLEKNIPKYYLFMALRYGMFFFIPIFVLYLKTKGITMTQVMLLQAVYCIMVFALEIPTGAIADQVGRKKTIAIGSAFGAAGILYYAFAETFTGFILAEIILALGTVMISGADTSIIYDTLKILKRESHFKKIQGRANAIGFAAAALASVAGGWLYTIDARLPMIAASLPFAIAVFVALSMREPAASQTATLAETISLIKTGIRFTATHKQVRWLVLYTAIYSAFSFAMFWLYQPFLIRAGISVIYFGPIFAAINLLVALGAFSSHRIENIIGEKASLVMIPALTTIALVLLSTGHLPLGFMAIILGQFAWGYSDPVINDYINRHIASRNRATILSINSLSISMAGAIVLPFIGYLVDAYTLAHAFLLSAFILFAINILLYLARKL